MTAEAFSTRIHGRWPDLDQNGHMRTAAYLDVAEDCRMQYFAANGFSMDSFARLRIGPVIRKDLLEYRAEIRLLQQATVELRMAGLSPDGDRMRLRNTIVRDDGKVAAIVTSDGGWLELAERRLTTPPEELHALLRSMPRTDDFEDLLPLHS